MATTYNAKNSITVSTLYLLVLVTGILAFLVATTLYFLLDYTQALSGFANMIAMTVAFVITFILFSYGLLWMYAESGRIQKSVFSDMTSSGILRLLPVKSDKDTTYASIAFWSSLFLWVPALNLFFVVLSVVFGLLALVRIRSDPKRYGGFARALVGLCLSATMIALVAFALWFYGAEQIFR